MKNRFSLMALAVAAFASQAASAATTAPLQAHNFGSQGVGFYSETSGSAYYANPYLNWVNMSIGNRVPTVTNTGVSIPGVSYNGVGYLGIDGHLHQVTTDINGNSPIDTDWTALSTGGVPATGVPASPGSPLTSIASNAGTRYFYIANGHIIQVSSYYGTYPTVDMTAAIGAPLAAPNSPITSLTMTASTRWSTTSTPPTTSRKSRTGAAASIGAT